MSSTSLRVRSSLQWGEIRKSKDNRSCQATSAVSHYRTDLQLQTLTSRSYTGGPQPDWSWWWGSLWSRQSCRAAWPDCPRTEVSSVVCYSRSWPASVSPGCCWWCWAWRGPWRRTTVALSHLSAGPTGCGFPSWTIFLFSHSGKV